RLDRLKGLSAIGHVRYSTTGENRLSNAQPLSAVLKEGPIAIAHNGNITNAKALRKDLQESGSIFQGTNDTEVVLHLMAKEKGDSLQEKLIASLKKLEGAFSLVLLTKDKIIAARDAHGFRPLCLGKLNGSTIVASETCAF